MYHLAQDCTSPDSQAGNCINFRFCSVIVNLIIQNQQKRDEIIENYIKKSICGYDGADPKVCCPSLIFSNTATTQSISTQPQPAPFIFSSINNQGQSTPSTSPPANPNQPTFSPLQTTISQPTPPNQTTPSNQPSPVIFGPIGSTVPPPTPQRTTLPPITAGTIVNRLPTNDADKCGISTAVRSRIVG